MKKILIICLLLLTINTVYAQPFVEYLNINAEVNNGYAITTIEEKLTNQLSTPTNDEFEFLIPEDAFISGFSIIIDGKEYKADVLPKKKAQEKFEEATSKGSSAGLVETKDKNLFSYSLSFEPKQSIIIRLKYEQAIKKTIGEYEYVLYLRNTINVNQLSTNITIMSQDDITTLKVPDFKDAEIKYISTTTGQIKYNSNALPNKDLRVIYTTNPPNVNGNMLFYQGYMMHTFSPTETQLGTTPLSKDIVFVIDKSGSMRGEKIEQVKRVFTNIISDLPPDDYFNVIFFDSSIKSYSKTLIQATTINKTEAVKFVTILDADTGTNINQALLEAQSMFVSESNRVPIIVFLTDGAPTEGITSPYVIRKNVKNANKNEVSIFTIAFGIEDEANYDFLKALSLENYGKAQRFYIEDNSETKISGFYKTISTPLITDMEFKYNDISYLVNTGENNLFAGSDAIVLGKYPIGTNTINSNISAITRNGSRDFKNSYNVVSKPENSFIPRLWAYTKIKKLIDRIDVEGETESLVSEVTNISLEYKFVTPYTSLFVEVLKMTSATTSNVKVEKEVMATQAAAPMATMTPAATVAATSARPAHESISSGAEKSTQNDVGSPRPYNPMPKSQPDFEVLSVIGIFVIYMVFRKRRIIQ